MYISPVALELELASVDITAGKSIDLNSAFLSRLRLSDGKYITVTPTWILNFSSQGSLNNGLYTPAITQTYDRIYAFYTYNGLTKSTFIDVSIQKDDTLLYISPDSINLNADETYDLRTVQAILEYMDGEQISVIPSWRILQGGGTIVNQIYTAPHTLAGEIILEAYHANISPTSYAKLHINKVEVSNAMNITSDNFTYSTAITPYVGKKFDISLAISKEGVHNAKEFKMIIFDATHYEIVESVSVGSGSTSVAVTPSVSDNLLKVNVLNKNGGKMIVTISNLTSAVAA